MKEHLYTVDIPAILDSPCFPFVFDRLRKALKCIFRGLYEGMMRQSMVVDVLSVRVLCIVCIAF